jgi:hypothetical protein
VHDREAVSVRFGMPSQLLGDLFLVTYQHDLEIRIGRLE